MSWSRLKIVSGDIESYVWIDENTKIYLVQDDYVGYEIKSGYNYSLKDLVDILSNQEEWIRLQKDKAYEKLHSEKTELSIKYATLNIENQKLKNLIKSINEINSENVQKTKEDKS